MVLTILDMRTVPNIGREPTLTGIVERMALALQGSLLLRYGDPAVSDAFNASRLSGDWGVAYGTLPTGLDTAAILDRVRVEV